jgi:hypothetical protein
MQRTRSVRPYVMWTGSLRLKWTCEGKDFNGCSQGMIPSSFFSFFIFIFISPSGRWLGWCRVRGRLLGLSCAAARRGQSRRPASTRHPPPPDQTSGNAGIANWEKEKKKKQTILKHKEEGEGRRKEEEARREKEAQECRGERLTRDCAL